MRRGTSGQERRDYITRLCERFGLIAPETVSLGLEPALEARLPPLIHQPGEPPVVLDRPVTPRPRPEDEDDGQAREPRRTLPTVLGPRAPTGSGPSPVRPPAAPPTLPSPSPPAPRGGRF
jgi:hypothetical protein